MRTPASPIVRGLAMAAVLPILMVGCSDSSDSAKPELSDKVKPKPSTSASPTLPPARFTSLPAPCETLDRSTVRDLVPQSKDPGGETAKSADTDSRASCSWNGLDGFQYRWLEVSYQRSDSIQGVGSAEDQARAAFTQLKATAAVPEGLKKGETAAVRVVPDLADEAQLVSAEVKKEGETYRDVSVVARKSNVVVSVSYDGAGFETDGVPKAKGIEKGALKAVKEALAAVK